MKKVTKKLNRYNVYSLPLYLLSNNIHLEQSVLKFSQYSPIILAARNTSTMSLLYIFISSLT